MKRAIILFYFGMFGLLTALGQTYGRLPWVNGTFPKPKNGFEYRVASGDASTLGEAQKIARSNFLETISSQAGVKITPHVILNESNRTVTNNNTTDMTEVIDFKKTTVIEGKTVNIAFVQVSECYEYKNGRYQLWELYEVSTNSENFKPYIPEFTDQWGLRAALRSAIIPGWGQFYKGKTGMGFLFLSTEVVAVSGIVYCETQRSDNMRKSLETSSLSVIKEYRSRADDWALDRNIAIGAAVGIYAWNVLDAYLSKGKNRYAWIPDNVHLTASQYDDLCYYGVAFDF